MSRETTCFRFSRVFITTRKTGNTGTEKVSGRTHLLLDGVYPLYRLYARQFEEKLWSGKNEPKFDKQHSLLFVEILFGVRTITYRGTAVFKMHNGHSLTQFFSLQQ